jgi:Tol biopolymer transport system component
MRSRLALVMFLASLAALAVAAPAQAAFPGANGKIVFRGYDQSRPAILVVNPDGSGQTLLTNGLGPYGPEEPAWSPDGTKIAYSDPAARNSEGDPDYQIFTMNADGSGQTNISQTGNPYYSDYDYRRPAWSPDGTKIVYAFGGLWTMNADGTSQKELFYAPVQSIAPAWSPDGRKIAFALSPDRTNYKPYQIYTIKADGSGQTNISNSAGDDTLPDWSPDGTKIAFQRSVNGGQPQIYTMNADGSEQTNISNSAAAQYEPAWSPDGTKVLFTTGYLSTMNPDGSGQMSLGVGGSAPDWQPLPAPSFKNRAKQCKAEGKSGRELGRCVSGKA